VPEKCSATSRAAVKNELYSEIAQAFYVPLIWRRWDADSSDQEETSSWRR